MECCENFGVVKSRPASSFWVICGGSGGLQEYSLPMMSHWMSIWVASVVRNGRNLMMLWRKNLQVWERLWMWDENEGCFKTTPKFHASGVGLMTNVMQSWCLGCSGALFCWDFASGDALLMHSHPGALCNIWYSSWKLSLKESFNQATLIEEQRSLCW